MWKLILVFLLLLAMWACDDDKEVATDALEVSDDTADLVDLPESTVDPCLGKNECEQAGAQCVGNQLRICFTDEEGCIKIRNELDCTDAQYGACDNDAPNGPSCVILHPCDGVSNCTVVGSTCDGDEVVTCEVNAQGCRVERRTQCSDQGASCVMQGAKAVCGLDPCAGLPNPCDAEGRVCQGEVLTICERNAYGCLVERVYDCRMMGAGCKDEGDVALCQKSQACQGQDLCLAEGRVCQGEVLQICRMDPYGCLINVAANCTQTSTGFGYCQGLLNGAVCMVTFNDSCEQFETCTTLGQRCDGDVLIDCSVNNLACLVETRTDCADVGMVCHSGGDVPECVDPCSLKPTCDAAVLCDGDFLVTCEEDSQGCLTPVDSVSCAAAGQVCMADETGALGCVEPPIVNITVNPNLAINDNATVTSTINVSTNCPQVSGLEVSVLIRHTYIGDLKVDLKGPSGTPVTLHSRSGGSTDDIIGTYPTTLSLPPQQSLSSFYGQPGNGNWTLEVTDNASGDTGTLVSWGLMIDCS